MPDLSLLVLASLAVSVLVLLLVLAPLLRRPPLPLPDPALDRLLAAQERQNERLGALGGDLQAAIARASTETGSAISGFTLEQTRLLNAGGATQRERLDAIEKVLLGRLSDDARLAATRLEEHRTAQGEAAATLRRDLGATATELKTGVEGLKTQQVEAEGRLRKSIADEMTAARDLIDRKAKEGREEIEAKLREMREANDARLADIHKTVNEQLQSAVEKQMNESFNRVIDQFTAVQKAMGDVQAVTSQIGDLKRLFSNIKTRGGWGEQQVKALLDDILHEGGYVSNLRTREDSLEVCEFGVVMPHSAGEKLYLPVDAKFPIEDYDRLLLAAETGDAEAERSARKALGDRIRRQAADIAAKYICPPLTVEFAVLYLPSDSLYAEVARLPGVIDEIGRTHRVMIMGPSLLPAMLHSIRLGHVGFALSRNAEAVREVLGATKVEVAKMDEVLGKLLKQAGTFNKTIDTARVRTRAISRKLRGIDSVALDRSSALLELEAEPEFEGEEERVD